MRRNASSMASRTAGHASAVGEARQMKTVAYSYDVLPRWVLPAAFRPSDLTGSVLALLRATNGPVPVRVVSEVHALHSRDRVGAAGGLPPVGRPARPAPLRQAGPALHALPVLLHPGAVHLHRLAQHRSTGPHPETAGRRRARPLTQNLSPPHPPGRPGQGGERLLLRSGRAARHSEGPPAHGAWAVGTVDDGASLLPSTPLPS